MSQAQVAERIGIHPPNSRILGVGKGATPVGGPEALAVLLRQDVHGYGD